MNLDDPDLTPAGASLSRPVLGPHRQAVAQFTPTRVVHPDELWEPFSRTTDQACDGSQGAPLGYRPGHCLEHEPLDQDEKASGHSAQNAYSFAETAGQIRSALRPSAIAG
jgi:hypothetical protein